MFGPSVRLRASEKLQRVNESEAHKIIMLGTQEWKQKNEEKKSNQLWSFINIGVCNNEMEERRRGHWLSV